MTPPDMPKKIHHGRNIRRFREMWDMKQEALAQELGGDWTQRKVSLLEQKETIEPEILEELSKILKVPVEAIKNLDNEGAVNVFSSTFNDNAAVVNNNPVFNINPVEKWLEALEEIKRLNAALLKEKDEKIALLERMLNK